LQICQTRRTTVLHKIPWLEQRHDWLGRKAVEMVESERWTGPRIEREARFYITSSAETAEQWLSSAATAPSYACTG